MGDGIEMAHTTRASASTGTLHIAESDLILVESYDASKAAYNRRSQRGQRIDMRGTNKGTDRS